MATPKKTVENAGRKVPIRIAGPTGAWGPAEMKHVATIFKIKCGTWYSRHYHYQVAVTEVPASFSPNKIRESAKSACEVMRKVIGKEITVVAVTDVTIGTQEMMKQVGEKLLGSIVK